VINQNHSAAIAAGRLRASGRNNQCPVCGRNKDGDCRFNHELILCHQGTRFAPPQHLRPGDVVSVNGKPWALIRTNAGFDGAAHEFRPDRGTRPTSQPRRLRRRNQRQASRLLHEVMRDIDAALAVPEFIHSTPDELDVSLRLIDTAAAKASALLPALEGHSLREQMLLLKEAVKQLNHQQRDANHFRHHYLGEVRDVQ